MTAPPSRIIRYYLGARAFLDRAKAALAAFDRDDDVSSLLSAALYLRFGIEARLYEYLEPALKSLGYHTSRVQDFAASVLLRRLTELNPDAQRKLRLRITSDQDGSAVQLDYTPVTKDLASIHGRLGDFLHYTFFWKRDSWFLRERTDSGQIVTLIDARDLVANGIAELDAATRGTLLSYGSFTAAVQRLEEEALSNDDTK